MSKSLLAFVEDPGAANFLVPLVPALVESGWTVRLLAEGQAFGRTARQFARCEPYPANGEPGALIAETGAKVLMVGTSENLDTRAHALVERARAQGVPSIGAIDSSANSAFRFRGHSANALRHAPDWLMVPDEWTRQTYLDVGFPAERAVICGHPLYDEVAARRRALDAEGQARVRARVLPDVPLGRPVVVFLGEISGGLNPAQFRRGPDYTLHGRGGADGRTEIVLEEIIDSAAGLRPRPYLVLRLHPKQKPDDLAPYLRDVDCVSSGGSALDLVYAADLVLGMTTSLLLEAAILGRPAISVLPRDLERDWSSFVKSGVTPAVTRREDLKHVLARFVRGEAVSGAPIETVVRFGANRHCLELVERVALD